MVRKIVKSIRRVGSRVIELDGIHPRKVASLGSTPASIWRIAFNKLYGFPPLSNGWNVASTT
jgi:hypothetical protein